MLRLLRILRMKIANRFCKLFRCSIFVTCDKNSPVAKDIPQLERIGEILERSLKRFDQSGRLAEYGVWPIWNDIVGPAIARNAQPEKIRQATLFVKVTTAMWMQQLQYMKEMIIDKLNERLGSQVVKNIFFFVGQIDTPPITPKTISISEPSLPKPEFKEEELELLKDPKIRDAFRRLIAARSRKTVS